MEFLYIGIGIVIVVGIVIIFLDVDSVSKFFAKKEKKIDDKAEDEEYGK